MNTMRKKVLAASMAAALALSFTACGGPGDTQEKDTQEGPGGSAVNNLPEFVYVPEFITLDDAISLYNATITGGEIYYTTDEFDEEAETWREFLCHRPLAGGEETRISLDLPENFNMRVWDIGEDGTVSVLLNSYEWDEVLQTGQDFYWMARYDGQGNQVFANDISEQIQSLGDNTYLQSMSVDGQGRFYLLGNTYSDSGSSYMMWLFDEEGNEQGTIPFSGWVDSVFRGGDGSAYVTYYDQMTGDYVLTEVDFDLKKLGNTYSGIPSRGSGVMYPLSESSFLAYDSTTVYEYDLESQAAEELFTWLDSDINGDSVRTAMALEDGRIAVIYQDWDTNERGVVLLTKTSSAEIPQKQQIVVAVMYLDSELQSAAVQFNRNSDQYHITVKSYIDTSNWTETSYADAQTNLNNDITSGNCPDIIQLSNVNVSQLAAKGVFEDLTPYLKGSSALDRSDMIESVLGAYTYGGVLTGIPNSFSLTTLVGSVDMVGSAPGWTLDELIAFADAHPGAELFHNFSKSRLLQICLMYNMDRYVDWNEGTCSFDTEEFKTLLEFANRFPDEDQINWESGASEPGRISRGEVLLAQAGLYDFNEIQMYAAMFGGSVTCIGYPNSDGYNGCILNSSGALAISARSGVKEGAWAFIEGFLNQERTWRSFGFPNSQSELEAMVKEATEPQYVLDENGDPFLDENGKPMVSTGVSSVTYGNGDWSYEYRMATKEEADQILALMDGAKPVTTTNDQIFLIISEEAEPYFQGQKTADEVASIIQSRAGIYVSENS